MFEQHIITDQDRRAHSEGKIAISLNYKAGHDPYLIVTSNNSVGWLSVGEAGNITPAQVEINSTGPSATQKPLGWQRSDGQKVNSPDLLCSVTELQVIKICNWFKIKTDKLPPLTPARHVFPICFLQTMRRSPRMLLCALEWQVLSWTFVQQLSERQLVCPAVMLTHTHAHARARMHAHTHTHIHINRLQSPVRSVSIQLWWRFLSLWAGWAF